MSSTSSISIQGFHFRVSTSISLAQTHLPANCSLHVLYRLDPHIYLDQYELAQQSGYSSLFWGTPDLEKPVSAVPQEHATLLLTADPLHLAGATEFTLDVPLHSRYGRPMSRRLGQSQHVVEMDRPVVFSSCASGIGDPVPDMLVPFTTLEGWPALSATIIPDPSSDIPFQIPVPVGLYEDLPWVDAGTAVVMIAMLLYLLQASVRTATRLATKPSAKTD